jgi:hypothetical protein
MPSATVARMESSAAAGGGLIPPARPQMIGEVLDAGFRLFRVSLLKCLPFSAASVIVSQSPTFYDSMRGGSLTPFIDKDWGWWAIYALAAIFSSWMLGWVFHRQATIARLGLPNARREWRATLRRLPGALVVMLGYAALVGGLFAAFVEAILPAQVLVIAMLPLLWLGVQLSLAPYLYWCTQRGVLAAFAESFRIVWGHVWRLTATLIVMIMTLAVFYFVIAILFALLAPAGDIAVMFALNAVVAVLAGAVGLPFVSALLIVAAEDLALRRHRAVGSR